MTEFVQSTPVACGMYVIAAGPESREGVIFSLSQGTHNTNPIYDLRKMAVPFLVQTNYDRWEKVRIFQIFSSF